MNVECLVKHIETMIEYCDKELNETSKKSNERDYYFVMLGQYIAYRDMLRLLETEG